jgi:ATP/maltotriose-dependent transcriptional regulator MalT
VVIDDLHALKSPDALAQLIRLLTNLPASAHAILATRHDLPLGLHQLRLAGELPEIRAADLRFSAREARELLDASGIALSAAGAARLHQRTEGWAAGLRLAALSLAGHPDPERFVAEFSGNDRTVAEYLLAEMLERQSGDVQDLLLRTCLLDRVNGELADSLTGRAGSERILLDLEDANAFVASLDPGRTWFRYHHLFADLLRLEVRRRLAASAHRELGDQRAANQAAERALALAEPDRLILPFVMTGSRALLEALPRPETAHAALLTDILDSARASTATEDPVPPAAELTPSELRILRYLPTNLSRPEIAAELSVSLNTVGTHLRRIYAKLGADDRSAAVQRARTAAPGRRPRARVNRRHPILVIRRGRTRDHRNPVTTSHLSGGEAGEVVVGTRFSGERPEGEGDRHGFVEPRRRGRAPAA